MIVTAIVIMSTTAAAVAAQAIATTHAAEVLWKKLFAQSSRLNIPQDLSELTERRAIAWVRCPAPLDHCLQ
jgi:hypothetical protein